MTEKLYPTREHLVDAIGNYAAAYHVAEKHPTPAHDKTRQRSAAYLTDLLDGLYSRLEHLERTNTLVGSAQ